MYQSKYFSHQWENFFVGSLISIPNTSPIVSKSKLVSMFCVPLLYLIFLDNELRDRKDKSRTRVWCDVAIIKEEMAFDNHISRKSTEDYTNPLCINPNILANVSNHGYTNKYAGSTVSKSKLVSMFCVPLLYLIFLDNPYFEII